MASGAFDFDIVYSLLTGTSRGEFEDLEDLEELVFFLTGKEFDGPDLVTHGMPLAIAVLKHQYPTLVTVPLTDKAALIKALKFVPATNLVEVIGPSLLS